jgi:hypothetical protein
MRRNKRACGYKKKKEWRCDFINLENLETFTVERGND